MIEKLWLIRLRVLSKLYHISIDSNSLSTYLDSHLFHGDKVRVFQYGLGKRVVISDNVAVPGFQISSGENPHKVLTCPEHGMGEPVVREQMNPVGRRQMTKDLWI